MSERVYVRVTVRKADVPVVHQIFDSDENFIESEDGNQVTLGFSEMSFGAEDELEKLRDSGIPYYGWREETLEAEADNFCGFMKKHNSIPVSKSGHYFLLVNENGEPLEKNAKRKISAYEKAEKAIRKAIDAL